MHPPCPITGEPARRRVQNISTKLLIALWRYSFRVDASRAFENQKTVGMWESPCGLVFFEPRVEGDTEFYRELYLKWRADYVFHGYAPLGRIDFRTAAGHVRSGDRVLEIGPGPWGLKPYIPDADYLGLEPHLDAATPRDDILREHLDDHAHKHPGEYDVVCAFHVIEHVADPADFVRNMLAALRPGGLLILAAPTWPSPMTDLPNFVLNAPPQHLTWWNPGAMRALCDAFGLNQVELRELPGQPFSSLIHWMRRFSPVRTDSRYFHHSWKWHLSLLFSALLGLIAQRIARPPGHDTALDVICIARKPG